MMTKRWPRRHNDDRRAATCPTPPVPVSPGGQFDAREGGVAMSDTGGGVTPRRSRTSRPRREPANTARGGASPPSDDEGPDGGQLAPADAATDNAADQEE